MTLLKSIKKLVTIMVAIAVTIGFCNAVATLEKTCLTDMDLIKQDITKISTSKDYNVILKHTYTPFIALLGGKTKYISMIKDTFKAFNDQNVNIKILSIGKPTDDILLSGKEVCAIPIKLNIASSQLKIQTDNYFIAIKNLNSNEWKYLGGEGLFQSDMLRAVIPDLPANFKLPETSIMPMLGDLKIIPPVFN